MIITRTNGPDDASRVIWAIRECFFISCSFLILTTVIYSFSNGPIRRAPVLLVPTSTPHSLPDASPYNPPPTPRPPPPPQKHPQGLNDEIQTMTITGPNDDINSRLRFFWAHYRHRFYFIVRAPWVFLWWWWWPRCGWWVVR